MFKVALDTHVCKGTYKFGLITDNEFNLNNVRQIANYLKLQWIYTLL